MTASDILNAFPVEILVEMMDEMVQHAHAGRIPPKTYLTNSLTVTDLLSVGNFECSRSLLKMLYLNMGMTIVQREYDRDRDQDTIPCAHEFARLYGLISNTLDEAGDCSFECYRKNNNFKLDLVLVDALIKLERWELGLAELERIKALGVRLQ